MTLASDSFLQQENRLVHNSLPGDTKSKSVAQMAKSLPAMQGTKGFDSWKRSPLEKQMATHFRILAWRIPWTEEPGGLESMGSQKDGHG